MMTDAHGTWHLVIPKGPWQVTLPHDRPRSASQADYQTLVVALLYVAHQAPLVKAQRWWKLPECGAFHLGPAHHFLRGVYLLDRHGFVVEWGQPNGQRKRLGAPATLDDMQRVLRLAFFEPMYFECLPWVDQPDPFTDLDLQEAWARAFRQLLGLAAPEAPVIGPLTIEQQRNDVICQRNLKTQRHLVNVLRQVLDDRILLLRLGRP